MPEINKGSNFESVTKGASGKSDWILLDTQTMAGLMCCTAGTFSATYSIEVALEEPSSVSDDTIESAALSTMTGLTAASSPTFLAAVPAAIRINVTSYTSGTVELYVTQNGDRGSGRR